jgi:hypothetical protein
MKRFQPRTVGTFRLWKRAATTVARLIVVLFATSGHAADAPIQLNVIGGVAAVSQYEQFEKPFWTRDVPRLTGGRVQAAIHPFDQSGLSGQEMLQFMRLGVVPFGTALLAMVSADEPELNAVDLPLLNPDITSLRKTVTLTENICVRSCNGNMASNCSASTPIRLRCFIVRGRSLASRTLSDARCAPPRSASPR